VSTVVEERDVVEAPTTPEEAESYGRGAGILTVGVAATGLLTAVFFIVTSHVLSPVEAKRVDLLWAIMWVAISVIYRPIEQLLSRTIAKRRAQGLGQHPLRTPALIQAAFGVAFLLVALAFHRRLIDDPFDGSVALYVILLLGITFYAVSYFARGWLAGHQHFKLYGGLLLLESTSRVAFAVAVAVGLASGQVAVAAGIAAAPLVSLVVLPIAFGLSRRQREHEPPVAKPVKGAARESATFAISVAGIMLAEQVLLNASVVSVEVVSHDAIIAGIVFNVLLIARAPLQLFIAVQTALLPHLAKLEAKRGHDEFEGAVRLLIIGIVGLTVLVAGALLLVGPFVMSHLFGQDYDYGRWGLAAVGVGMGFHLASGTLNQAALARHRDRVSSAAWLACAALFMAWTFIPLVNDPLLRVELGYLGATVVLTGLLYLVYRSSRRPRMLESAGASQST
jgi:O-antigen/teichoic acid export membrane protein